jgi:hypothetical protein
VPVLILLALAAILFRASGDAWPVVAAKLLAIVVLYLIALYVFFGVVLIGMS